MLATVGRDWYPITRELHTFLISTARAVADDDKGGAASDPTVLSPGALLVKSTPANTARTELHSMITFHHANTRGSRDGRLRIAHLCVPETIVIHVSCLIPCRT